MGWIKLETHTANKLEIFSIAQELNLEPDAVLGKCCRVWSWFDDNTTDGVTKSVTQVMLDRQCGVTGFCAAMINAGWMFDDGISLKLPYYDRHNSQTAKSRALGAKRQAKFKTNAAGNANGNDDALPEPSHREEKRREEKKEAKAPPTPQAGSTPKASPITLQAYIEQCATAGIDPIPEDDGAFAYADKIGLSRSFLTLHWAEFKERNCSPGAKRQKSWRQTFGNSVRSNWFKLWYIDSNGGYALTTAGQQAKRQHGGTA